MSSSSIKIFFILTLVLYLFSNILLATTGADFLKIPTNPRSIGMGEAFCAISDDINNININPAGLGTIKEHQISLTHMEWVETMNFEYLAYAIPIKNNVLCGSIIFFYLPSFTHYGDYGEDVGKLNMLDFAFTISYSRVIFGFSVGANFKFLLRNLAGNYASGCAFDIGILKKFNFLKIRKSPENNFSLGFVVQNLGPKIKFLSGSDPLPINFKFGVAYKLIKEFLFTIDFNKPIDIKGILSNFGVEFSFRDILFIRCGYKIGYKINNFSTGIGISYKIGKVTYYVDYAFILGRALNNIHAFSIKLAF